MEPFVTAGVTAIRSAITALEADGLPRDRIWLGGFSQGACLALEAFAREGEGLAGVIALSGGLVGTADADGPPEAALYNHRPKRFDYPGRRAGTDVWISVHQRDPHIPLARVEQSVAVLRSLARRSKAGSIPARAMGCWPTTSPRCERG